MSGRVTLARPGGNDEPALAQGRGADEL